MFIKAFITIIFAFCSICYADAQHEHSVHCAPELQNTLTTLQQLPEINDLIDQVLEEGCLYIETNCHQSKQFGGYWSSNVRTIWVTSSPQDKQLSTLLFEMHNALRDSDFKHLEELASSKELNRESFIEQMEYLEYQNALDTSELLDSGIEEGIFPPSYGWYPADTFEEHFRIQKSYGHSDWIGKIYDQVSYTQTN